MSFWALAHPADRLAVVEEKTDRRWTYGDLQRQADSFQFSLPLREKSFGFLLCRNTPGCLAAYIGALQAKAAVALVGAELAPELLATLLHEYHPDWIAMPPDHAPISGFAETRYGDDYALSHAETRSEIRLFPDLAVLLSTSGSTASPKLVRLSYTNLQANAESINQYLRLNAEERPITSLPMQYSYGLSIINSHLAAGATLLLTDRSLIERRFWEYLAAERATSLAGVPYMYQVLLRVGLLDRDMPSLRTLTQAGGALAPKFIEQIHAIAKKRGWSFYVMYGQTEATARISYVPPDKLGDKIGSVGLPIPGGKMRLEPQTGEIIYNGPNVMLGYAQQFSDLALGDELKGELHTGDLGRQDETGYFYVTGRLKRFLKILGQRFSLDDIERRLHEHFEAPLACFGRDDLLCIATEDRTEVEKIARFVGETYHLHQSAIFVLAVEQLPRNANGKTGYQSLTVASSL